MAESPWDRLGHALQRRQDAHLFRQRRVIQPLDATHVEIDGRRLINFSSNNYLGLAQHPRVCAAARDAIDSGGFGAAASPLISGYSPIHAEAERAIAGWKCAQGAVLFPSGYQANLAAIQTAAAMGRPPGGVRFIVDKLAHASLVDAIRGSGQPFRVFPHNHMTKLARLLAEAPAGQIQVVVTESIFSMDGDAADLVSLSQLKKQHDFVLILDEAHATGVYGPQGTGLAAELGLGHLADFSVFTLSKAMGGIGGAICGTSLACDAVVNFGRAYFFSTGVPAAVAAAAQAAIGVMADEPQRQARVRELSRFVRARLAEAEVEISAGDSPIIPIILGDEQAALHASDLLAASGFLVQAVRPPTVAKGSSRLRLTLCCEHTDAEIEQIIGAVARLTAGRGRAKSHAP